MITAKKPVGLLTAFLFGLTAFGQTTGLATDTYATYNGVEYPAGETPIYICDGETVNFSAYTGSIDIDFRAFELDLNLTSDLCINYGTGSNFYYDSYYVKDDFGGNLTPNLGIVPATFYYDPNGDNTHYIGMGLSGYNSCTDYAGTGAVSGLTDYRYIVEVLPNLNPLPNPQFNITTDANGNDIFIQALASSTTSYFHRWEVDDTDPSTPPNFQPIYESPSPVNYDEPTIDLINGNNFVINQYFLGECVTLKHIIYSPCLGEVSYEAEVCFTGCGEGNGKFGYDVICFNPESNTALVQLNTYGSAITEDWDAGVYNVDDNNQVEIPWNVPVTITHEFSGQYDYHGTPCEGVYALDIKIEGPEPCEGVSSSIVSNMATNGDLQIEATINDATGTSNVVPASDYTAVLVNGVSVPYTVLGSTVVVVDASNLNHNDVVSVEYAFVEPIKNGACCYFNDDIRYSKIGGTTPCEYKGATFEGITNYNTILTTDPNSINFYSVITISPNTGILPVVTYDDITVNGVSALSSNNYNVQMIYQNPGQTVYSISPLSHGDEVCLFYSFEECEFASCYTYRERLRKESQSVLIEDVLSIENYDNILEIESDSRVDIRIVDVLGHIVYNQTVDGSQNIDLRTLNLSSGIYMVEGATINNRISKKIIIN